MTRTLTAISPAVRSVSRASEKGGRVTLSGDKVTYTPPRSVGGVIASPTFVGTDSFTYQVCDTNECLC